VITKNKATAEAWRRADEERAYWEAHEHEFIQKYPDQFVALKDGQVIASEVSLDALVEKLEKQGLDSMDVRLRYVNAHPGSFVL
jgi:hypothetical protein